jgi:hypothetical protein
MLKRTLWIFISLIICLLPISGIYFGTQIIRGAIGITIGVISMILLLPCVGNLFDSITNNKVLYINVNKPWEMHLRNKDTDTSVKEN